MKTSQRLITELSNEVIRLENQIDDFMLQEKSHKKLLEESNTNARLYRGNLVEAHNRNKELLDFITQMLANVGKPINEEIRKYSENL